MEDLRHELRTAAIGTVILDLVIWLVSVLCIGWRLSIPLGLLIGSIGMFANLLLLRRTVRNAVYHGKRRDTAGYLVRLGIASACIVAGLCVPQISAIACVLPFLYPKVLFGVLAVSSPKGKKGDS